MPITWQPRQIKILFSGKNLTIYGCQPPLLHNPPAVPGFSDARRRIKLPFIPQCHKTKTLKSFSSGEKNSPPVAGDSVFRRREN